MPAKSEPLFAAVARLCDYDKQAQKAEVWGRIESELRAHEEEQRRRELEEKHELEAHVGSLEGQLAAERRKIASASEDVRILGDRNAALEAQGEELRRALESRADTENKTASLALAVIAFVGVLVWLTLFQRVTGIQPRATIDLSLAAVVAGLLAAAFYQGAVRAMGENPFWRPFYRRIDPEALFSWTWKFLASFVAPLAVADWLLGSERVYSALPMGTFGWEAFVSAVAVGLVVHFLLWVSPNRAQR